MYVSYVYRSALSCKTRPRLSRVQRLRVSAHCPRQRSGRERAQGSNSLAFIKWLYTSLTVHTTPGSCYPVRVRDTSIDTFPIEISPFQNNRGTNII